MPRSHRFITSARTLICCVGIALAWPALALADTARFEIKAEPLPAALKAFAQQAHMQLLYEYAIVQDVRGNSVIGIIEKHAALKKLLRNTGLEVVFTSANAATIKPTPAHVPTDEQKSSGKGTVGKEKLGKRHSSRGSSIAQASGGQAAAADAVAQSGQQLPSETPATLQEVVVTAEKRAENLQNVPISVAAYTREDIERLHITDISDIIRLTPGIGTTYTAGGLTPILSIRGIASNTGESTTGLYIDDTPIQVRYIGAGATTAQGFPLLFDLERVEVLRGPQGTLFGAGSEGGTIRFITPEPSFSGYSGHMRAEAAWNAVGSPSYQLGSAFGGPLVGDTVAFRVSAYAQQDGGWIDWMPYPEPLVAARNANSVTTIAFDGALAWRATDSLTITPKIFYQDQVAGGIPYYWPNASNPGSDAFKDISVVRRRVEDEFVLPTMKIDWQLGTVTVFSNTSYMHRKRDYTQDYTLSDNVAFTGNFTGTIAPAAGYNQNPQNQFTEELRLQSADPSSRLSWVLGGFFQSLTERAIQPVTSPGFANWTETVYGTSVLGLFGVNLVEPGDLIYYGNDYSKDKEIAGFGQVEAKLTDELTLTAGLRYGTYKFEYTNYQDGPFNGGPTGSSGSGGQSQSTPKIGLSYKSSQDQLIYASASKGFRPGGPNTPVPSSCDSDLHNLGYAQTPSIYNPDSVWSYELGWKGDALERRLIWDASAYYLTWAAPQTRFYLPTCGEYSIIANAGAAVSKGFDLQGNFAVTNRLVLEIALGYDNARYTKRVRQPSSNKNIVSQGELLPTPPWHAMLALDYAFGSVDAEVRPYLHLDDTFANGYGTGDPADALYDLANPRGYDYSSVNVASGRLGVRGRSWDASIFSTNLLNSHPIIDSFHAGGPSSEFFEMQTLPPRIVGFTVRYRF
jgi:iron complex outermembrane recepter protein